MHIDAALAAGRVIHTCIGKVTAMHSVHCTVALGHCLGWAVLWSDLEKVQLSTSSRELQTHLAVNHVIKGTHSCGVVWAVDVSLSLQSRKDIPVFCSPTSCSIGQLCLSTSQTS
jgi:hypothetical protein